VTTNVIAPAPTITSISPTNGPGTGGTTVTILGNNFTNGATVTFGGTNAWALTFNNATSLTAVTPPHLGGWFNVTVTNPDTQNTTTNNAFYFATPPRIPIGKFLSSTGTLVMSWTNSGWRLFGTTNPMNIGLQTNVTWTEVRPAGSDYNLSNQAVMPIVKTNPTVFYRLINP
jgi:hypothetical protein